jgi:hypothetical protein
MENEATAYSKSKLVEYVKEELVNSRLITGLLVKSFLENYGEKILEIAKESIYKAGRIVGQKMALGVSDKSLHTLAKLMISFPYDEIFNAKIVEANESELLIQWRTCPIKDLFENVGLQNEQIKLLCQVLEHYDKGIVEGFSPKMKCIPPSGPQDCTCRIYIE